LRHRRASRDVASFARPRASSSESSESPHAYFANASSIADDMSRSHRARRAARAREWNGMEWRIRGRRRHGRIVHKNMEFSIRFVFFCFVLRASTRSFVIVIVIVIHRRARDSIRLRSIRLDSTCARSFSRGPRARARGRASRRDDDARRHHLHHRWHPRRPGARERDEVDARGGARWRRMGFHPMRTCVRERTRTRARDATRRRWMIDDDETDGWRRRARGARWFFRARRTRRRRWRRIGANFERGCWRVNERRRWRRNERERRRCRWKI